MNSSVKIDFLEFNENRKLYAADSLNNLNKLNLCTNERDNIFKEYDENSSDVHVPDSWTNRRSQSIFFSLLVIAVIATLIVAFCSILLLVQASSTTHEVSQRLEKEAKDITKISKLLLYNLNQTRI
ncbi:leucine-rich single-pass membrane protein 1 isoform X2 [Bombina bombina]|nr:leucine-rich single-pass membrane protein 1 isoform X2 [Bombina bombina]